MLKVTMLWWYDVQIKGNVCINEVERQIDQNEMFSGTVNVKLPF